MKENLSSMLCIYSSLNPKVRKKMSLVYNCKSFFKSISLLPSTFPFWWISPHVPHQGQGVRWEILLFSWQQNDIELGKRLELLFLLRAPIFLVNYISRIKKAWRLVTFTKTRINRCQIVLFKTFFAVELQCFAANFV